MSMRYRCEVVEKGWVFKVAIDNNDMHDAKIIAEDYYHGEYHDGQWVLSCKDCKHRLRCLINKRTKVTFEQR